MSDFTSKMNAIHEYNFGNKTQNISSVYINSNNIYYNTSTCNNNTSTYNNNTSTYNNNITTSRGTTLIYANNIPLWFSQQHCKISG
jgi:hypothetical protein